MPCLIRFASAKAFGLDIVFYDPFLEDGIEKSMGVRRSESLQDLIGQSFELLLFIILSFTSNFSWPCNNRDIVSLNCWLDESNRHLINETTLSYIKKPIYFVNVARGGLVDEVALVKALKGAIALFHLPLLLFPLLLLILLIPQMDALKALALM